MRFNPNLSLLGFCIAFMLSAAPLHAQSSAEDLIREGIELYDNGEYPQAIRKYEAALKLEPDNLVAKYELSSTYYRLQRYDDAIKMADEVMKGEPKFAASAAVIKGSALDDMGKRAEATKFLEKAVKKYGDYYLLHFNLALAYVRDGEKEKAMKEAIEAIEGNSVHASSHLMLGMILADEGRKVESIMSLHFFLMLEPDSKRAENAYKVLREQFGGNVREEGGDVQIMLDHDEIKNDEFGPAVMMLSLIAASNSLEENEGKSEAEMFQKNTTDFFKFMGETKNDKHEGLVWDLYVPFFAQIAESDHMEYYCHRIRQSGEPGSKRYLEAHPEKADAFFKYIESE